QEISEEDLPGLDALRRIVSLCRENDIEPVFMMLPAPVKEEEQLQVNAVGPLASELGVPFINMLDHDPLLVDFETDMYDYLGHMNPDGAAKLTAYLGNWLTENYDFADKRGNASYAHWDENLSLYEAHRERVWSEMTLL
ncbi:MAG: hypothetical protein Q4A66_12130, partial [Eubacteriales bacterium]|nr:hypothetical protein [Eubacteriales bacterium]